MSGGTCLDFKRLQTAAAQCARRALSRRRFCECPVLTPSRLRLPLPAATSHLTLSQISIENLDRAKDTIMDIKKKVEEKEGISPEQQR